MCIDNYEESVISIENRIFINGVPLELKKGDNKICRCQIRCCDPSVALDEILTINRPNNSEDSYLVYVRHEFDEKVIIKRKEYREVEISKIEEIMSLDLRGRATINCINGKIIIKSDEDKNFATMASDIDSEYNYFELTERMKKSTTYTLSIRDAICLADGSKITFFKEIEQNWDWDEDEWI